MYLGIDLGDKRCGVAVFIEGVVIPKEIVSRHKLVDTLKKYILEYSIKIIVVGLPHDLFGRDLKQLDKTKKFIEKLKNIFPDIKVEGIDERYTSFEADNILNQMGNKDNEGKKDAISASLILESYIKSKS